MQGLAQDRERTSQAVGRELIWLAPSWDSAINDQYLQQLHPQRDRSPLQSEATRDVGVGVSMLEPLLAPTPIVARMMRRRGVGRGALLE